MDAIFKALSDKTRREILDVLREKDGLALSDLEEKFPGMTRFGVMKHLKVLEEASLIATYKEGRFKYHYLNAAPIQEIADRWISSFAAPWTQSMSHLKTELERTNPMSKPQHIYVNVIKTTPEKLWAALTDGKITPHYYYGGKFQGKIAEGEEYKYIAPDGENLFVSGKIIEVEPNKKLVCTFKGSWMTGMENDPESKVTWEIEDLGNCCKLTLTHHGFEEETTTFVVSGGGWPGILSGLKTYLETGETLGYDPMAA
ncbi:MAG: metalloregulator ArsR/SmtB family transcription factor [Alphaproteobacteria bacterium]|nr:metalloregulator ArsR/SmtB family transcription factor [Alphaproteobacteria bacterium]